jgi:hypothetical protein
MRYMRGLNEWLERDVHDRQAEIRGVTARVDQLRNDVGRMGGMRPPGTLFLLTIPFRTYYSYHGKIQLQDLLFHLRV